MTGLGPGARRVPAQKIPLRDLDQERELPLVPVLVPLPQAPGQQGISIRPAMQAARGKRLDRVEAPAQARVVQADLTPDALPVAQRQPLEIDAQPAPGPSPSPSPAPPAAALKTLIDADGTYKVGVDIAPGTYTSGGPDGAWWGALTRCSCAAATA